MEQRLQYRHNEEATITRLQDMCILPITMMMIVMTDGAEGTTSIRIRNTPAIVTTITVIATIMTVITGDAVIVGMAVS